MKERIIRLLRLISFISFGTLIATAVWCFVSLKANGESVIEASIPYVTLWQIVIVGAVCGTGSEVILGVKEVSPLEEKIRLAVHYVFINLAVLFCGYKFGWYKLSFGGVMLMLLTSAAVYAFTFLLGFYSSRKTADKLTKKLEEYNKSK